MIRFTNHRNWFLRLLGFKPYSVVLEPCLSSYSKTPGCGSSCDGWKYKSTCSHPTESWIIKALRREEYIELPTAKVIR
jgi:hypothetical protein